ncbi:MAG: hypothetical protein IJ054_02040 [Lachnospiraceae bacterium]|nr:hypothetical protein [Lachnospiraceae bacterium]MBQ9608712.1 hypothetical protein [Lachnospiraceae bacterium]
MKKIFLCVILCIIFLLVGCGSNDSKKNDADNTESSATGGIGLTYNSTSITLGDSFDNIKSGLGEEIRPSEEIAPCDGEGGNHIEHYYNGLLIGTDMSGNVAYYMIQSDGDDTTDVVREASTDKGLKLGDSADRAKELYGEPYNESDYVIAFSDDTTVLTCGLNEDKTIMYFYFTIKD